MMKSLLVGLDGSDDSHAVLELGLRWAMRFDALVVGLGIIDEPGIFTSGSSLLGGPHYWRTASPAHSLYGARRQVSESLEEFVRRCHKAGVECRTLEDVGSPFVQILMEAQRYDLILLGQQTHFDYGSLGEPDETLGKVLQESPRPVVAVPRTLGGGESIVVAYDGSLQSARALSAFEGSGLGQGREIHVVSVSNDKKEATRRADRAVEFLQLHSLNALPYPVGTDHQPPEVLLEILRLYDSGLLVMGAYGQPVLREFFLGSTTRTMLEKCPVPLLLSH
ncbi:universal stress protein [Singulisphaera acidiphila]|uniref:Universal stress protein UspA-like protein n=1 Tax=Singulisphaera acidiphila (strain ATCC BAA-1392 / DSM 18658 / VKM B-2454 / MOB10) TaxID=886293 RepID=L0DDC6_SINAD|nr:universal stress protein [Singulisphaera acidiphila]AGA26838.1 universal stress protein UspA-like protein [Singulisphaera acidiphila DSM 18658]